jgi:hypothetical protein
VDNSSDQALLAHVTKFNLAQLRIAQVLIPMAILTTALARHRPEAFSIALTVGTHVAAVAALFMAIRRIGLRPIRQDGGTLRIGDPAVEVSRSTVRRWTFSNGVATLYGRDATYRLRAETGQSATLESSIRTWLGAPETLERRGSPGARLVALCIALSGLALTVAAFVYLDSVTVLVVGVPCFIVGTATYAALSQRVISAR